MELLTNSIPQAFFYLPAPGTMVGASWSLNGVSKGSLVPVAGTDPNKFHVDLPYTQSEGTVVVTWQFTVTGTSGTQTAVQYYDLVTPYLDVIELADTFSLSSAKATELESQVRHVINAHCGQSFGFGTKTLTVQGQDGYATLPERLINLTKINDAFGNAVYDTSVVVNDSFLGAYAYSIDGDGWFLKYYSNGHTYTPGLWTVTGVIRTPDTYYNPALTITGDWGWFSVPQPVKEAAKILANLYFNIEGDYRDQYLTSMTAADWRIQFKDGAFRRTGSVKADQLLDQYVTRSGWVVF